MSDIILSGILVCPLHFNYYLLEAKLLSQKGIGPNRLDTMRLKEMIPKLELLVLRSESEE